MARIATPWYWEDRAEWCVNLNGQRRRLGPHPDGFPSPKKTKGKWNAPPPIMQAFHALMAAPPEANPQPAKTACNDSPLVSLIFDKYLDWCQREKAPRTFEWYRDHLQHFLDALPNAETLTVKELKPFHVVVEWIGKHPDWSPTYQRGAIIAVQRPFGWAEEMGLIESSPIKKIKKPQPQRRENPMMPEDYAQILAKVKEADPFRDLLLFFWHTGCRPQEARHLEPRHVHLAAECIVIPKNEAKGKRRPRIIHLHGPALEIITRLMQSRTEGKLFLNAKGRPWKKFAVCNRFDRLRISFGLKKVRELGLVPPAPPRFNRHAFADKAQMKVAKKEHQQKLREWRKELYKLARKHGKSIAAYDARHGFAQRLLENGANHMAVAELLGHSSGRMIAETYSHMNKATAHLKETLKKASGEGDAA